MSNIVIRSITGLFYASLIIGSAYLNFIFFSFVIFLMSALTIYEFQRLIEKKNIIQYLLLILLFTSFTLIIIDKGVIKLILFISLFSNFIMLLWLFKYINPEIYMKSLILYTYPIFGCFFIIAIPYSYEKYEPVLIFLVYAINWINNSFAYIIGKNFGKNKLLKNISPNKSWEGFFGGMLFSLLFSLAYYKLQAEINFTKLFFLSFSIPVLATLGDLVQSKIKREAGAKDSGNLLPGHGGFFDRMDSIIFVAPWSYFVLNQL